MQRKDYKKWSRLKSDLHNKYVVERNSSERYIKEREVRWCVFGENIGHETDGKGESYTRPCIILRKYNKYTFLVVPITSNDKERDFLMDLGKISSVNARVNLSQMRVVSFARMLGKISIINYEKFQKLLEEIVKYNFPAIWQGEPEGRTWVHYIINNKYGKSKTAKT